MPRFRDRRSRFVLVERLNAHGRFESYLRPVERRSLAPFVAAAFAVLALAAALIGGAS